MIECSVVFEELREAHAQLAVPGYLNSFSKVYEKLFEGLCDTLDEIVLSPTSPPLMLWQLNEQPPNASEIEDQIASLSAATALIHLTQAIYFQPNPSAIMAEDLMHWVNRLESRPDQSEGKEIVSTYPASHHPSYWTFLQKYPPRFPGTRLIGKGCFTGSFQGRDRLFASRGIGRT
jgi:Nup85 Nucleoporin